MLWAEGVQTAPLFATTIVRENPSGGYYSTVVDWTIPAGAYRVGVAVYPTQPYSTLVQTAYDPRISNIRGAFTSQGAGLYPANDGAVEVPAMGQLFLARDTKLATLDIDGQ
jgi:hypothetical protein